MDIQIFSETHQRYFGTNIVFGRAKRIGSSHNIVVKVKVHTFFGVFIGKGSNKKVAKAAAAKEAYASKNCPFLNI